MTFNESMQYLSGTLQFGVKPGLARMRKILALLGNPEKRLKAVHIAGTNGKGSCCAYVHECLTAAGYRCGLFTSPHLEGFCERMVIGHQPISKEAAADLLTRLRPLVDEAGRGEEGPLTEFEIVTAMMFAYFAEQKCDICVMEVGLGGLLDSTNVIEEPLCCGILHIALDHMKVLGNSIAEITGQKCGIIKPGRPVVAYPLQEDAALEVLRAQTREKGAPLFFPKLPELNLLPSGAFSYEGEKYRLAMPGDHQVYNAVTAIEILYQLRRQGFFVGTAQLREGLQKASLPARAEWMGEQILLDGSHNPDGISALCRVLDGQRRKGRLITVMGMMKDKDYPFCIGEVAKRSDRFLATTAPGERGLSAAEGLETARGHCADCRAVDDPHEAVREAMGFLEEGDTLLVCGSLYLAGELRADLLLYAQTTKLEEKTEK